MSEQEQNNLLASLAGASEPNAENTACKAATESQPSVKQSGTKIDEQVNSIIDRIRQMTSSSSSAPTPPSSEQAPSQTPIEPSGLPKNTFIPLEPTSFNEAGLTECNIEALILKFLLAHGDINGREIAEQIKLPFVPVEHLLRDMKNQQLIAHRGSAAMNDFQYQLTDIGRERARRLAEQCSYFGSAPVPLADYVQSVHAQSLTLQHPTFDDLRRAFEDLLLNERMFNHLGPAINSGRGMFLFGPPGNGKTSIAERITAAFGQEIWIPRAIGIDGEILRVFDPVNHEELPLPAGNGLIEQQKIDRRWVRIRRPTIVTGGELTMSQLEVTFNNVTGICEAPLQLKSNCGTLVIDDFGRQRMRIDELLNRWIVPLEKRYDFLGLPNGKKIKVPFDQLIIFSTNLEPRALVDEAFLRRIPYKIEVSDPTEEEFYSLFASMAAKLGIPFKKDPIDYLLESCYKKHGRAMRFCHPRDLLLQIRNYCIYYNCPLDLSNEYVDKAVDNYFSVM
ncbi:MAG: AAA family ATPase [Thermoguttaceae bacterium]